MCRAAPTGVRRGNVPTRRVGDQHGHAIGRTRSNGHPFGTRDERVSLQVGNGLGDVGAADLTYAIPMHLPLLEEAIGGNPENFGEARSVLAHCLVVIAEMKTEVERVVRRVAHPARTRGKRMAETMPLKKARMPRAHRVLCSMLVSRESFLHAEDTPSLVVASCACWEDAIQGRLGPIEEFLNGKLELDRGHLPTIIGFAQSLRQVVVRLCKVPTEFP
jgi:hypothetical protein